MNFTSPAALRPRFREIRAQYPGIPATVAMEWARESLKVDALEREADWSDLSGVRGHGIAVADFDGFAIYVYDDPEDYDWGDIAPTQSDIDNLEVIDVGVRLNGERSDRDQIWSVGYTDHDMRRNALETAVYYGFVADARAEVERRRDRAIVRGEN